MIMNPMQLIQMIKSGGNPQQMIMNMMRKNAGSNPVMNNALQMMEKGDTAGIENMVKNICKERGLDPNEVMKTTQNMFGVK